jgi:hypothetical protein
MQIRSKLSQRIALTIFTLTGEMKCLGNMVAVCSFSGNTALSTEGLMEGADGGREGMRHPF